MAGCGVAIGVWLLQSRAGCGPVQDCILCRHLLRWRFRFGPDPKRKAPGWPRFVHWLPADITRRIILRNNAETRVASRHDPLKATGATMSMEPMYRYCNSTFVSGRGCIARDFGGATLWEALCRWHEPFGVIALAVPSIGTFGTPRYKSYASQSWHEEGMPRMSLNGRRRCPHL